MESFCVDDEIRNDLLLECYVPTVYQLQVFLLEYLNPMIHKLKLSEKMNKE